MTSQAKALIAANAAIEKLAEDVLVIDVRSLSTITDFIVVCTGQSSRQLDALKNHIDDVLSERGAKVWHTEGFSRPSASASGRTLEHYWVLMDCGDIVVHIMDPQARAFYQLERLWADAPRLAVDSTPRTTGQHGAHAAVSD